MSDDTKKDSEQKADDKEKKDAESDQEKSGSDGAARPADDDIIIK